LFVVGIRVGASHTYMNGGAVLIARGLIRSLVFATIVSLPGCGGPHGGNRVKLDAATADAVFEVRGVT